MNNKIGKEEKICGWESQLGRTQLPLLKSFFSKGINLLPNRLDIANRSEIPIFLPRRKQPKSKYTLMDGLSNPFQLKRMNFEQNYFQHTPKHKKNIDCISRPSLPKINSQRIEDRQKQQEMCKRQQINKKSDLPFIKYNTNNEDIAHFKLYRKLTQLEKQDLNEHKQHDTINEISLINRKESKTKLKLSTVEITHNEVLQKSKRESEKYSKAFTIEDNQQNQKNNHKRSKSNVNTHKIKKNSGKSAQVKVNECPEAEEVFNDRQLFGSKSQRIQHENSYIYQHLKSSIELEVLPKRKIIFNHIF